MALTLQQVLTLAIRFGSSNFDSYWDPANVSTQVAVANRALRVLGRAAFIVKPNVGITFQAGVWVYNLRDLTVFTDKVVDVFSLYIKGFPLLDPGTMVNQNLQYGIYGWQEFERRYPDWQSGTLTTGDPTGATTIPGPIGPQLIVYPPPSAGTVAYTNNFLCGQILPADMTTSTVVGTNGLNDYPPLPEELHEPMAYLTHRYAVEPDLSDDQQMKLLDAKDPNWTTALQRIESDNRAMMTYTGPARGNKYPTTRWT